MGVEFISPGHLLAAEFPVASNLNKAGFAFEIGGRHAPL
jgi:hypothetical protein